MIHSPLWRKECHEERLNLKNNFRQNLRSLSLYDDQYVCTGAVQSTKLAPLVSDFGKSNGKYLNLKKR